MSSTVDHDEPVVLLPVLLRNALAVAAYAASLDGGPDKPLPVPADALEQLAVETGYGDCPGFS